MGFQKGNTLGGRKTKGNELALVQWYESVLPEAFKIAKDMLLSQNKTDKLWAMEWLKTGIVKMIPQKIGGDKDNPIPVLVKFMKEPDDNNGDSQ